jgi:hypothetical protein
VLLKIRKLGAAFGTPQVTIHKDGVTTMHAEMVGELVKVPEALCEPAEMLVGELTMGIFPVGLEIRLDKPDDHLNGLWVQKEIFDAVTKLKVASA